MARFTIELATITALREELSRVPKIERLFTVELVSADGTVHAVVDKTLHVSRREPSASTSPTSSTGRA
jgi:hypothetical protein